MKIASMLVLAAVATSSYAVPIVQRNFVDGSFMWYSATSQCWTHAQNQFDFSKLLTQQTGVGSARSMKYDLACDLNFGCTGPFQQKILTNGVDCEMAGGGTMTFRYECYLSGSTVNSAWRFDYGQQVGPAATWVNGQLTTELIGGTNGEPTYVTGSGPFTGIRVRLADGWHYGWFIKEGTVNQPGALFGEAYPLAYAIESQPNTPITLPPCRADINMDGAVDFFDYLDFVDYFARGDFRANFSIDARLDFFDYLDFVDAYAAGC